MNKQPIITLLLALVAMAGRGKYTLKSSKSIRP